MVRRAGPTAPVTCDHSTEAPADCWCTICAGHVLVHMMDDMRWCTGSKWLGKIEDTQFTYSSFSLHSITRRSEQPVCVKMQKYVLDMPQNPRYIFLYSTVTHLCHTVTVHWFCPFYTWEYNSIDLCFSHICRTGWFKHTFSVPTLSPHCSAPQFTLDRTLWSKCSPGGVNTNREWWKWMRWKC